MSQMSATKEPAYVAPTAMPKRNDPDRIKTAAAGTMAIVLITIVTMLQTPITGQNSCS